jgi:hypothetical protein
VGVCVVVIVRRMAGGQPGIIKTRTAHKLSDDDWKRRGGDNFFLPHGSGEGA